MSKTKPSKPSKKTTKTTIPIDTGISIVVDNLVPTDQRVHELVTSAHLALVAAQKNRADARDAMILAVVDRMIENEDWDGLEETFTRITWKRWRPEDIRALFAALLKHAHPDCLDVVAEYSAANLAIWDVNGAVALQDEEAGS